MRSSPRRLILDHEDPHCAAAAFLSTLAYPERTSASARDRLARALQDYRVHHVIDKRGREVALSLRSPGDNRPIHRRNFAGRLDRGFERVARNLKVLELYERRQARAICTFKALKKGRIHGHHINRAMPPWTEFLLERPQGWKRIFALNTTGLGAGDDQETVRKLLRRVIRPCSAVLHLAYGLAKAAPEPAEDTLESIKAQLWEIALHPETWLQEAAGLAQVYPYRPYPRGGERQLHPSAMIKVLWRGSNGVTAHPDT